MNFSSGFGILIRIGNAFLLSMIFGFALLKIYGQFEKAFREKNRFRLWWAFTSAVFLLTMIVFLFAR